MMMLKTVTDAAADDVDGDYDDDYDDADDVVLQNVFLMQKQEMCSGCLQ